MGKIIQFLILNCIVSSVVLQTELMPPLGYSLKLSQVDYTTIPERRKKELEVSK